MINKLDLSNIAIVFNCLALEETKLLDNGYQLTTSVAWISLPRTGTNYLCELLQNHHRIESHYEIFHKHKFYAMNRQTVVNLINRKHSTSFSNYRDPNLIKWIHSNPYELLKILKEISRGNYFSFKIFPGQLKQSLVRETIINDSSIKKILVKRNLLDVYVSRGIAMELKKWGHTDTSKMKLEINFDEFLKWFNWVNQWYRLFEDGLTSVGQNFSVITYRSLHSRESDKDKFIYLINFLRTVGINLELQSIVDNVRNDIPYKKQDRRSNIADKILNYQEFEKKTHNAGLEHLLWA